MTKSNVIDRSSPDFWKTYSDRAAFLDDCLNWLFNALDDLEGEEPLTLGHDDDPMWWEVAQDDESHDEESYLEWSDFAFTFDTVILEEIFLHHLTPELPRMATIITAPACPFTFPTISTQPIKIEG